jgi:hypothetical protein
MNSLPNVERANHALRSLWRRGILPEPVIEAEALEAAALRGRPAWSFGEDQAWRIPFETLVHSLRAEADLNPLGRVMAHSQIVTLLRSRMRAEKLWKRHPAFRNCEMAPPIIILGQMRSGTTRMQRLLACDRRFAHTRTFETLTPVPAPGRTWRARAILAALNAFNPTVSKIHPTRALAPDEEFGWLAYGFGPAQFEARWRVPSFARRWEGADRRALYREFRDLLRLNADQRGEDPRKPWVLKAPQFLQDLPTLLDAFPGAKLVCLERDYRKTIPSSASLVWNQMRIQSDSADKAWIGREWARKTRLRKKIATATIAACPDLQVIRLAYESIDSDWRAEIKRVYAFLGMELTGEVSNSMAQYLERARAHRGHRYSVQEFGLGMDDLTVQ